jgi:hypothetical protein
VGERITGTRGFVHELDGWQIVKTRIERRVAVFDRRERYNPKAVDMLTNERYVGNAYGLEFA